MRLLTLSALLVASVASADEGMWLFNDFPTAQAKQSVGVAPDAAWLDRVRLGSLRLANGCSASLVSADGLVMTNHHCIRGCLEDLSTPERDLLSTPFIAKDRAAEERCQKTEANQLVRITDVTERVLEATQGSSGADYQKKLKAEQARLESGCAQGDATKRCDVVTLFHGAKFHLYEYRRYQDVRLVFAPEFSMAAFGGDPDNFNFPRYGLDVAFLRLYVDGKPRPSPERLAWAKEPAKEKDPVFVSGHPGNTDRLLTVAQLEYQRDVALPYSIALLSELRGRLDEWLKAHPALGNVGRSRLRSVENSLKAQRGAQQALAEPSFFAKLVSAEVELKRKAPASTLAGWDSIAEATKALRGLALEYRLKERGDAFNSELFGHARALVRHRAEKAKPNAERLPEFTDARLPGLTQSLGSQVPVSKELEIATLSWSLQRLREALGADDAFVRSVLGSATPLEVATQLVEGTGLADAKRRLELLDEKAFDAATDPLLAFAKKVDADARAIRQKVEAQVDAPQKKGNELLAEARRTVLGPVGAPDATFTLRLSFGRVQGTATAPAMTTVEGLFTRATGKAPFALTEPWLKVKPSLKAAELKLPYNVSTTNDIIGGNSGSPLVNAKGDVVGLVFDGNLASLGGRYGYEPASNRAVAVHGELIQFALMRVYGAKHLAEELLRR